MEAWEYAPGPRELAAAIAGANRALKKLAVDEHEGVCKTRRSEGIRRGYFWRRYLYMYIIICGQTEALCGHMLMLRGRAQEKSRAMTVGRHMSAHLCPKICP
jgi:hypothetical protein